MILIQGKGVSNGVAIGPLYFYQRAKATITRYEVADADAEWARFKDAQAKAIEQLGELAEKAREEAGDEAALLFETHQMMAEDMEYEEAIQAAIQDTKLNAEAAVTDTAAQFAEMFASMDDPYFQARAADVKDVSSRIIGILAGVAQGGINSPVPVILAADDLAPSETVQLDKSKILGFVTEGGSGSSHTAILARTMGIPAVIGVDFLIEVSNAENVTIVTDISAYATSAELRRKGDNVAYDKETGKFTLRSGNTVISECTISFDEADLSAYARKDMLGIHYNTSSSKLELKHGDDVLSETELPTGGGGSADITIASEEDIRALGEELIEEGGELPGGNVRIADDDEVEEVIENLNPI